jgi:FG-GAP repeat protein
MFLESRSKMIRPALSFVVVASLAAAARANGPCVEPCTVLHTFTGEGGADRLGWAIENVGDLDGDGVADLVAGAPFAASGAGRALVTSGATGSLLFTITGDAGDAIGWSVSGAGDVNGDGIPDVIAGGPGTATTPGRAIVASGADGSTLFALAGEAPGDGFGWSVASAGDADGDGLADVVVGATHAGPAGAGRAYVFAGPSGSPLRTLDGEASSDQFGSAAGFLGDVDGDGRGDVVIGAKDAGPTAGGKAYVFSGAAGALLFALEGGATSVDFGLFFASGPGDVSGDGVPDVLVCDFNDRTLGASTGRATVFSGADGSVVLSLVGAVAGEGFGIGRGAGDVDGDGRADLIVGAYASGAGGRLAGRVAIHSGRDGSRLRRFTGAIAGDQLGFDVTALGDVNGDGSIDYAMSAPTNAGRVYVMSGSAVVNRPAPRTAGQPSTIRVSGCLPGARVFLAAGRQAGATPIARCPGLVLGIASPRTRHAVVANASGDAAFDVEVPLSLAGRTVLFQALELPYCRLTAIESSTFL